MNGVFVQGISVLFLYSSPCALGSYERHHIVMFEAGFSDRLDQLCVTNTAKNVRNLFCVIPRIHKRRTSPTKTGSG